LHCEFKKVNKKTEAYIVVLTLINIKTLILPKIFDKLNQNTNRLATILLIFATTIWASTFAIVKDTMQSVDVFFINFTRSLIAALPLLIFTAFFKLKTLYNKDNFVKGFKIGLVLSLTYALQNIAMLTSSASNTAFILSSNVIFVPVILFLFYKHRINGKSIISIAIVAIGLFLMSYDKNMGFNYGDIISLVAAIIIALHIIMTGKYVKTNDLLALISYQFLFSAVFSLIFNLIFSPESIKLEYSTESWGAIIYLGIFGTLVCYFIAVWAQKYLSYITVTLIYSLEPVFAAVFAFFILSEMMGPKKLLGAGLILFGVIFIEIPFRKLKIFK
jgi:drug/metabolite transporter (DMT)-like permease